MPRLVSTCLAAACALALALALSIASAAAAAGKVPATLRVVTTAGKVLAEKQLRTGTAQVKTSPRATCFGPGTGGSGGSVTIEGATALGLLAQGARTERALRPLLVSDHFSFGLALCGIGGHVASGEGSWYLKVNHRNPQVGGELAKLRAGDEVLWYLADSFPYPDELVLRAPKRVRAGKTFSVRVFAYDDAGKRHPAAGIKVTGAASATGADGRATVTLARPARLIARGGGAIPSARVPVCVGAKCPRGAG